MGSSGQRAEGKVWVIRWVNFFNLIETQNIDHLPKIVHKIKNLIMYKK